MNCPTCGSSDPKVRKHRHHPGWTWAGEECVWNAPREYCTDPFHVPHDDPQVSDNLLRRDCTWDTAHAMVDEALRITQTDRNSKCGDPEDNLAYIALVWTALLRARGLLTDDQWVTAGDVARMMSGLKLCRDSNAPARDNRTDNVGYAICLERVEPTDG